MNKKQILLATILSCTATSIFAQAEKADSLLNRTVVVENIYNPEIMSANKINLIPTIEEPQQPKKQIAYANTPQPVSHFEFTPMENYGATPQSGTSPKGYLRAGYGTNNNVDGRLGYRFELGRQDEMNASLSFRGMDGNITLPEKIEGTDEWILRDFRTHAAIDWRHLFNTLTLRVKAEGENQVFNYPYSNEGATNRHQHNLMGNVAFTLDNHRSEGKIRFTAGTGVLYAKQKYAFDHAYNPTDLSEFIVRSHALVSGKINVHSAIHIKAQMDNIFMTPGGEYRNKTNTLLQLNPYFTTGKENWNIRIGIHAAPIWGEGMNDFAIAPDLYGEYHLNKRYAFYLKTDGGYTLNDFRTVNLFAPYAQFPQYSIQEQDYKLPKHSLTQLNAQLGFKATPINELGLQVYGGYKIVKDCLFSIGGETFEYERQNLLMQEDANILYAGAAIQYSWKDIFTTQAGFEWKNWDTALLDEYTTLIPEWSLRWEAEWHPLPQWNIGIQYQYEQRCKDIAAERAKAINNLSASVSYRVIPTLTVFAHGNNLLNQKYYYNILHPAQGINALLGASLEF